MKVGCRLQSCLWAPEISLKPHEQLMNFIRTPIMRGQENIHEACDPEVGATTGSLTQSESLNTEGEKAKHEEKVSAQENQPSLEDKFPDGGRQAWLAVLGSWVGLETQVSRRDDDPHEFPSRFIFQFVTFGYASNFSLYLFDLLTDQTSNQIHKCIRSISGLLCTPVPHWV